MLFITPEFFQSLKFTAPLSLPSASEALLLSIADQHALTLHVLVLNPLRE